MNLAVQHPNNVAVGFTHVAVMVTNEAGTEPVPDVVVCLYKEGDVHAAYTTDASGAVGFDISPATTGDITVTVYDHGYIPYEGVIEVTQ